MEALGIVPLDLSELEDEIWNAIKKMPSDKSPGPDGMTGAFYKSVYGVMDNNQGDSVDTRQFRCLNSALPTLIPKKPDAAGPQDFRPISLTHI